MARWPARPCTFAHAILRQALGEAVRDGRLDHNVAARARPPRLDPNRDPDPPRATHLGITQHREGRARGLTRAAQR